MQAHRTALRVGAAAAAALVGALSVNAASAATADRPRLSGSDCFSSRDWVSSRAPSDDTLYIKVRLHDYYRIDLHGGGARRLNQPGTFLITKSWGTDRVCAPVDLDMKISDNIGFTEPLIAKGITRVSREEVAALPRRFQP